MLELAKSIFAVNVGYGRLVSVFVAMIMLGLFLALASPTQISPVMNIAIPALGILVIITGVTLAGMIIYYWLTAENRQIQVLATKADEAYGRLDREVSTLRTALSSLTQELSSVKSELSSKKPAALLTDDERREIRETFIRDASEAITKELEKSILALKTSAINSSEFGLRYQEIRKKLSDEFINLNKRAAFNLILGMSCAVVGVGVLMYIVFVEGLIMGDRVLSGTAGSPDRTLEIVRYYANCLSTTVRLAS